MQAILGVDTGGTYTDAVLVDQASGAVLSHAKALTTYHNLATGVRQAIEAALSGSSAGGTPASIRLVALSTTLATNALVEGRGSPVSLLLIGYDRALLEAYDFHRELATDDVVYLAGGHDGHGDEVAPLDERAAREAILARAGRVEAFAVSGYFGVRNPAHELRVKALVEALTGPDPLPVTCGHELTSRLDSVRRATTTALNARLIPLLRELVLSVQATLDELGIGAPLMIVRGDGSLVSAAWATERPIETILSGPAASVVGARHLAQHPHAWVLDMGGTTTDIAVLDGERPRLNRDGAHVGGWRTMIEAVDVRTVGLGGDSLVTVNGGRQLTVGPQRAIPLCLLAAEHPAILLDLQASPVAAEREALAAQYVLASGRSGRALSDAERALLDELTASGPRRLAALVREQPLVMPRILALEARRLVLRAGFTPTDALHALGLFTQWEAGASAAGAAQLASILHLSAGELCRRTVEAVSDRLATEIVTKALADEGAPPDWEDGNGAAALLARALGRAGESSLGCALTLHEPLVAIGAPASAYSPRAAEHLHTGLDVPQHAGVASALGAAMGGVIQEIRALIQPVDDGRSYRLHLPDGVHDFGSVEQSVQYARQAVPELLRQRAQRAGADHIELHIHREDSTVPVRSGGELYLGTELTFTAVGRPRATRSVPGNGAGRQSRVSHNGG